MFERISVVAIAMCLGACASSGPEAPAPAADTAPAPAAAAVPDAPGDGGIHDLDAPNVEATTAAVADGDEMVCRREIITGTKMSRKVCRRRADVDAMEEDSQEALRNMRKSGSQMERGVSN